MSGHNAPGVDIDTEGRCGPVDGPNCVACRVLKNNLIAEINSDNYEVIQPETYSVWQGSSGFFYCGRFIGKKNQWHDGYCGANNGVPCQHCMQLIDGEFNQNVDNARGAISGYDVIKINYLDQFQYDKEKRQNQIEKLKQWRMDTNNCDRNIGVEFYWLQRVHPEQLKGREVQIIHYTISKDLMEEHNHVMQRPYDERAILGFIRDLDLSYSNIADKVLSKKVSITILSYLTGPSWKLAIDRAIDEIQKYNPGIQFKLKPKVSANNKTKDNEVKYGVSFVFKKTKKQQPTSQCSTKSNLIRSDEATVKFGEVKPQADRYGTALHELLHALGFKHEFKRFDREQFGLTLNKTNKYIKKKKQQFTTEEVKKKIDYQITGLTKFDPQSIMNYGNKSKFVVGMEYKDSDLWEHSSYNDDFKRRNVMSQLDKITLNLIWSPAKTENYNATKTQLYNEKREATISMYYCGRAVMKGHNYPYADNKKYCGGITEEPEEVDKRKRNGPNCASCRTIKNGDLKNLKNNHDKHYRVWQGYSGYFYCGRDFQNGKLACGPDFGRPCPECLALIDCDYESDRFVDCFHEPNHVIAYSASKLMISTKSKSFSTAFGETLFEKNDKHFWHFSILNTSKTGQIIIGIVKEEQKEQKEPPTEWFDCFFSCDAKLVQQLTMVLDLTGNKEVKADHFKVKFRVNNCDLITKTLSNQNIKNSKNRYKLAVSMKAIEDSVSLQLTNSGYMDDRFGIYSVVDGDWRCKSCSFRNRAILINGIKKLQKSCGVCGIARKDGKEEKINEDVEWNTLIKNTYDQRLNRFKDNPLILPTVIDESKLHKFISLDCCKASSKSFRKELLKHLKKQGYSYTPVLNHAKTFLNTEKTGNKLPEAKERSELFNSVQKGDILGIEHIICILMYCHFPRFIDDWIESTDENAKDYFYFTKYFSEILQCWGNKIDTNGLSVYHGITTGKAEKQIKRKVFNQENEAYPISCSASKLKGMDDCEYLPLKAIGGKYLNLSVFSSWEEQKEYLFWGKDTKFTLNE